MEAFSFRAAQPLPCLHRPLSQAQVDTYWDQGYLIVPSVFDRNELTKVKASAQRLAERALGLHETCIIDGTQFVVRRPHSTGKTVIDRIVWAGGIEPYLAELGADKRLLAMVGDILERPIVDQLINQLHFKYPGDGVAFDWHQDSRHRRYGTELWKDLDGRGSFVQTLTAIDPMTALNGPLVVIPRSHQLGHLGAVGPSKALPKHTFDPADGIPLLMKPGDVLLMNPFTIHMSEANHGKRRRLLFINGFAISGANRRTYPGKDAGRPLRVPGRISADPVT